jgi:hypothetical protein
MLWGVGGRLRWAHPGGALPGCSRPEARSGSPLWRPRHNGTGREARKPMSDAAN